MADPRFPRSERGTNDRGTKPAAGPGRHSRTGGRSKGVIFLLTAKGHAHYEMRGNEPTDRDKQVGQAVFENSEAFVRNLNRHLRQSSGLDHDPLEIRYFTTLGDILNAVPGADVANGRWLGAAIVSHATFRADSHGRKMVPGLWLLPDGVFADNLRSYAGDSDLEFSAIRSRFDPAGTLNIFACSGPSDHELACAVRAFFGLGGDVSMPRATIQIRSGGVLYTKIGDKQYRPFNPKDDIQIITDCKD